MTGQIVGILLDDGGSGLARALISVATGLVVALFVAVVVPVAVLGALLGGRIPPVSGVPLPSHAVTPIAPPPGARVAIPPTASGSGVVEVARQYLGIRYLFGGTDPAIGLDCSGLVQLVFQQIGLRLPRTAQQQFDATMHLSREQLAPGDLVFFARTYADV